MVNNLRDLKVELQALGARFEDGAGGRISGAGPAEGRTVIFEGIRANVPFYSGYARRSPFIVKGLNGKRYIFREQTGNPGKLGVGKTMDDGRWTMDEKAKLRTPYGQFMNCPYSELNPALSHSILPRKCWVNTPNYQRSPALSSERAGRSEENPLTEINFPPTPNFYGLSTEDGVPFKSIALLHGDDCLASTVLQTCVNWEEDFRCGFCGIETSLMHGNTLKIKRPEQLAEVALAAKKLDYVRHVTLTSGTTKRRSDALVYLARCSREIKKVTGLPIHIQFQPPEDLDLISSLLDYGVDTVGIHIESFDRDILEEFCPSKASPGMGIYNEAWKRAVEVFGRGKVSSFIIVGLGEERNTIIKGSKYLADLGVYPFVVPLRPIPGSLLEGWSPPDPTATKEIYQEVTLVLKEFDLTYKDSTAGCVRCGACSALPQYEEEG